MSKDTKRIYMMEAEALRQQHLQLHPEFKYGRKPRTPQVQVTQPMQLIQQIQPNYTAVNTNNSVYQTNVVQMFEVPVQNVITSQYAVFQQVEQVITIQDETQEAWPHHNGMQEMWPAQVVPPPPPQLIEEPQVGKISTLHSDLSS